ncbi:MAG: hypothetical protein ACYC9O_03415 [Candidatus Latescibacterota bacterium]
MTGSTMVRKSNEHYISIDRPKENEQTDSFHEMCRIIERERTQTTQNGGGLSLVVFSLGNSHGYTYAAHVLWKILTRSDRAHAIGWFDEYHPGVVIPDVFPAGAAKFAAGVCIEIPSKIRLEYTVFSYPDAWLDDYREYNRATGIYSGSNQAFPLTRKMDEPHGAIEIIPFRKY